LLFLLFTSLRPLSGDSFYEIKLTEKIVRWRDYNQKRPEMLSERLRERDDLSILRIL